MKILIILLYISILIFAERITDYHHAYNRCSEMNLITCNSIASLAQYIKYHMCQILDAWCSIILMIKKSKYFALSNKFLKYKIEWIVTKISCNGKCESEILHCLFTSVAKDSISVKFSCGT